MFQWRVEHVENIRKHVLRQPHVTGKLDLIQVPFSCERSLSTSALKCSYAGVFWRLAMGLETKRLSRDLDLSQVYFGILSSSNIHSFNSLCCQRTFVMSVWKINALLNLNLKTNKLCVPSGDSHIVKYVITTHKNWLIESLVVSFPAF